MKRFAGLVVALSLVPAGTAAATAGGSDLKIVDNKLFTVVDGPGFTVGLTQFGLYTHINDRRFGIPEAGRPIERAEQPVPSTLRAIVCENGTYRFQTAVFKTVERASATAERPAPYPPAFNAGFPDIITFVGTIDGTVINEAGETFRLLMSDLAHEELTTTSFTSTNPIHAYIVDARGRVRDRASLVGRVSVDRRTGQAKHSVIDEGTCHQTANQFGQIGIPVFGPFFVLPFPTTVVRR